MELVAHAQPCEQLAGVHLGHVAVLFSDHHLEFGEALTVGLGERFTLA